MAQPFTRYVLDDAILDYDIGFDVTSAEGLNIYINGDLKDLNFDYTISGTTEELNDGDGVINLTLSFVTGDEMVVLRRTEEERVTNFETAARFEEKELDAEFDNFLRLIEDALLYLTATPYFAPEDIGTIDGQLPAKIPGGVIRLNEAGDGFEYIRVEDFPEFAEAIAQCVAEADRAEQEANNAETSSQAAQAAQAAAVAARDFAQKWASEAEDVEVDDGVNPPGFSAFHWAQKALQTVIDRVRKIAGPNGDSDQGAAVIPTGDDTQQPAGTTDGLLRFSLSLGRFRGFNPTTGEWGNIGGGGFVEVEIKNADFTVEAGKVYGIDLSVNDIITATVPDGFNDDDGYGVIDINNAFDDSHGVVIQLTAEEFVIADPDNAFFAGERNSYYAFQKVNGKHVLSDSSYGQDATWAVDKINNGFDGGVYQVGDSGQAQPTAAITGLDETFCYFVNKNLYHIEGWFTFAQATGGNIKVMDLPAGYVNARNNQVRIGAENKTVVETRHLLTMAANSGELFYSGTQSAGGAFYINTNIYVTKQ